MVSSFHHLQICFQNAPVMVTATAAVAVVGIATSRVCDSHAAAMASQTQIDIFLSS